MQWREDFNIAVHFYRFGLFSGLVNFCVNPIFYYLSIVSFKKFVNSSAKRLKYRLAYKMMIAVRHLTA